MKPSAVLLIDLENFYLSREDHLGETKGPGYDRGRFGEDLEKLLGFARSMTDGLPFTVKRAYANYQAWRPYPDKTRDFYLRSIPDELMQQGVEPVQVFRLSQGRPGPGGKNAADMRMAMDATALLNGVGNVEHFVLVTGDADFIPVILELKRHGHTVSVIGVTGATNELIQRFVDNFELFEDLLDAEQFATHTVAPAPSAEVLAPVAEALRTLLARTGRVRFKTLKPLLPKLLKHALDPGTFGCETALEFLRKYAPELGVMVRPVQNDFEIDLPGAGPPLPNGTPGSKVAPKPAPRPTEKAVEKHPKPAAKTAAKSPAKAPGPLPEPHTPAHYGQLLAGHAPGATVTVRVPAVPWSVLVWGCDAVIPALTPPDGGPATSVELLQRLNAAAAVAIPELARHVRFIYPVLRAGLAVPGADGIYSVPEGTTGEQIRHRVLQYIISVLNARLSEYRVPGAIRPEALAAVFQPGPELDRATAEVAAALVSQAPAPEPVVPPIPAPAPKPARGPDAVHTPASYQRLLKGGGARGTEYAAVKITPAPWPVVERVCADAVPILTAPAGGPVPRDQLLARVIDAGNALCLENYPRLARRALTILQVAGELNEKDGVIGLNPEVTSAHELRNRVLSFVLQLLHLRLVEREVAEPIHPPAFAAAVDAGPLTDALVAEIEPAIKWLYDPAPDDPHVADQPPSERAAEMPATQTRAETVSDSALDRAAPGAPTTLEPAEREPGAGTEVRTDAPEVPLLDPVDAVEVVPDRVEAPRAEPGWDASEFDGALPGVAARVAAALPTGPPKAEGHIETVAAESTEPNAEPGTVPLSDITSAAVASAAVPAPHPLAAAPEPELAACAPRVPEADPTPLEALPVAEEEEPVLAVLVAPDWLPDGDPVFAEEAPLAAVRTSAELLDSVPSVPVRAASSRPVPTPVAKIVSPPLTTYAQSSAVEPPPVPPSSESA